jgi:phosphopantothenoylcysteine decarboxylase/phosphopantothenate--cysteine ligase
MALAQEHELLVIAPATADLLAKLAHGLADDFLTTLYLAFTGPVLLAPAMNVNMWQHAATQANLETLSRRGHIIVEPESGYLACGMTGPGRLADPETVAEAIEREAHKRRDLEGETVLITAGPTQEPLDPVRYISNRSSGKMGYGVAAAALRRGAQVTLVSGPTALLTSVVLSSRFPNASRARTTKKYVFAGLLGLGSPVTTTLVRSVMGGPSAR